MAEQPEGITLEQLHAECERYLSSPETFDIGEERMLDLIEYALDTGDYSSAWLLVGAALARFPENKYVWLHLAFILYEEHQIDYALAVLRRFTTFDYWAQSLMVLIEAERNPERVPDALRSLVRQTDEFQEDTLANIFSVAHETGQYALMCELLPELERKTQSYQMLSREMAVLATAMGDEAHLGELIEKYIDACPYDPEAWCMKANYHITYKDDPDESINSAEYALAIDPDSVGGHLSRIRAALKKYTPEVATADEVRMIAGWFDSAVDNIIDSAYALELYADFICTYGLLYDTDTQARLYELNKLHPESRPIVDLLLRALEGSGEWEIQEFLVKTMLSAVDSDDGCEQDWVRWSRDLRTDSMFHAAHTVMRLYYESREVTFETTADRDAYLEMMYLCRRYSDIMVLKMPALGERGFVMTLFHKLLSAARLGLYEEVPAMGAMLMTVVMGHSSGRSMPELMSGISVGNISLQLLELANQDRPDAARLDSLDPYSTILKALYPDFGS